MGRESGSGAYLSSSARKKLASDQAREAKASSEEDSIDGELDAAKTLVDEEEDKPIVIDKREGGTSHNCPCKDAGESHSVTMRCVRSGHVGVCRDCNHLVSARYGCSKHKNKGDRLQYDKVKLTGWEDTTPGMESGDEFRPWESPSKAAKKDKKPWWKEEGKGLNHEFL